MSVFTSSKKVTHLDKRGDLDNDVFWTKKLSEFFFWHFTLVSFFCCHRSFFCAEFSSKTVICCLAFWEVARERSAWKIELKGVHPSEYKGLVIWAGRYHVLAWYLARIWLKGTCLYIIFAHSDANKMNLKFCIHKQRLEALFLLNKLLLILFDQMGLVRGMCGDLQWGWFCFT